MCMVDFPPHSWIHGVSEFEDFREHLKDFVYVGAFKVQGLRPVGFWLLSTVCAVQAFWVGVCPVLSGDAAATSLDRAAT